MTKKAASPLLLALAVSATLACASSPRTRFYVLRSIPTPQALPTSPETGPAVGVGPVEVPDYLDRPQIVTRSENGTIIQLGEFDRWAEPLVDSIARVLADDLSILLVTNRVAVLPWQTQTDLDFRIPIQVIRFDANGRSATLEARWSILGNQGETLVPISRFHIEIPVAQNTYEAVVLAESQALDAMSRELAGAVRKLGSSGAPPVGDRAG